ncbi:MAG: dipicolinate synthase subunit B [Oscillospiraceae bacterium]|nr:dipicolinate synthase subunit B [Oscillospiraceae bacterium]
MTRLGFAMCGSFCSFDRIIDELKKLAEAYDITPIMSPAAFLTDTRFGLASSFVREVESICSKRVITAIEDAEPIGPKKLLDVLAVAPCTGCTLARLARGMTDTCVAMACKAHLRNGGPVVIAVSTNDGLSASAENIGRLLDRKNIYFVPFGQDDPQGKPCSLVADFSLIGPTSEAALQGRQLQPLLLPSDNR